jgi:hypothetical protein
MVSLSRTSDASMAPVQASPITNGNIVQMDREAARLCALYATSAPGFRAIQVCPNHIPTSRAFRPSSDSITRTGE